MKLRPDEDALESLRALLRDSMPAGWASTQLTLVPEGFRVVCVDDGGVTHTLGGRLRLRGGAAANEPAFAVGEELACFYVRGSLDAPSQVSSARYRETFARWIREERRVSELLAALHRDGAHASRHTVSWNEGRLTQRLVSAGLARGRSLESAVASLFEQDFPAGVEGELGLYFESSCAQACEFCALPAFRASMVGRASSALNELQNGGRYNLVRQGVVGMILAEATRRRPSVSVLITGHDWARHPALDELIRTLESHPTARVRLLGPSTRLADPALAARIAGLVCLEDIALTLQSIDPDAHDAIVGAEGSGREVVSAIENLLALDVVPTVMIVLTSRTIETLPETLAWLVARGMPVNLNAFIPDRVRGWNTGRFMPRADIVRAALASASEAMAKGRVDVVGVPICAVPDAFRARVAPAQETPGREPAEYPAPCSGCRVRSRCSGVPRGYVRRHGVEGIVPVAG